MSFKQRKPKDLACACGEVVKNVNEETVKVTCWRCTMDQLRGYKQTEVDRIQLIFQPEKSGEKVE